MINPVRNVYFINKMYYSIESQSEEDHIMSIPLRLQLSTFGNYSIPPKPETISGLMGKINLNPQIMFLPNIIKSQKIEIPTNQITSIANIGFITQDQQYIITLLNERIDINFNNINNSTVDISDFFDFAIKIMAVIEDYLNISSNRLAINIQCVHELNSMEQLISKGRDLLKSASYYDDKQIIEWSTRTNAHVSIDINNVSEELNVITDISSVQDITGKKSAILFLLDINTTPQNQNMRFDKESLSPFVKEGINIASNLMDDVERLISDD